MRDKVVLITGSSSGIGAGVAVHFASLGCKLSLTGRNEEGLRDTQQKCLLTGLDPGNVMYTVADVVFEDQVKKLFDLTIEKYGQLDVLVNNAGMSKGFGNVLTAPTSDFDLIMSVNLRSAFHLTKLAMPYLYKSKGNVINVSSIGGQKIYAGTNFYGVSKAALDHLTRLVALEEAPRGVRVNAISPGAVITAAWEKNGLSAEKVEEDLIKKTPLGRVGTTRDMAQAVEFLADDRVASFITGTVLVVDGGLSLNT